MPENSATNKERSRRSPLYELSRKILLASIGAMALAQDEIEDFVNKLVDRGEIAEKDGRKLIREIHEKRKADPGKAAELVENRVKAVMEHFDVPTKADIEGLSKKISTLTKKVDELRNQT